MNVGILFLNSGLKQTRRILIPDVLNSQRLGINMCMVFCGKVGNIFHDNLQWQSLDVALKGDALKKRN